MTAPTTPPVTAVSAPAGREPLAVFPDVAWAPRPNRLAVLPGDCHTGVPVTSVIVLVRDAAGAVLLTHVDARGWDAPGGHLEDGEDPPTAALRELAEETGLVLPGGVPLAVAATQHLHVDGPEPAGYRYPHPDSRQLVFTAELATAAPHVAPLPGLECSSARWVPAAEVTALVGDRTWVVALAL